jgi:hypothetical protein
MVFLFDFWTIWLLTSSFCTFTQHAIPQLLLLFQPRATWTRVNQDYPNSS